MVMSMARLMNLLYGFFNGSRWKVISEASPKVKSEVRRLRKVWMSGTI